MREYSTQLSESCGVNLSWLVKRLASLMEARTASRFTRSATQPQTTYRYLSADAEAIAEYAASDIPSEENHYDSRSVAALFSTRKRCDYRACGWKYKANGDTPQGNSPKSPLPLLAVTP